MLIKKDRCLLSSTTRVSLDILHNRSHIYIYIYTYWPCKMFTNVTNVNLLLQRYEAYIANNSKRLFIQKKYSIHPLL